MLNITVQSIHPCQHEMVRTDLCRPLMIATVSAGFPSPAEGSIDRMLDLNELLIRHPTATFFVRVQGDSMKDAGILDGDLLVVEKGEKPTDQDIVLAIVEGEFTIKRWICSGAKLFLCAENPQYPDIDLQQCCDWEIWGVVRYAIHACQHRQHRFTI
jgi:DNA polymerase V